MVGDADGDDRKGELPSPRSLHSLAPGLRPGKPGSGKEASECPSDSGNGAALPLRRYLQLPNICWSEKRNFPDVRSALPPSHPPADTNPVCDFL